MNMKKTITFALLTALLAGCGPKPQANRFQPEPGQYRSPDFTTPLPEGKGVGLLDYMRETARQEVATQRLRQELGTYRDQLEEGVRNSSYYKAMDKLPLLRETIRQQEGGSFGQQRQQVPEQEMANVPQVRQ